MNNRKTMIRFFTIADYEEIEAWLQNQHKNGWKLSKIAPPCFYVFKKCIPKNVSYRLDYKNNKETGNYFQIFKDYGWEYIGRCFGWLYFRKPISETDSKKEGEIFSDNESRVDMINHVIKTRLFPVVIIFLCCVFPYLFKNINNSDPFAIFFTVFFFAMTILYIYLIIYCSLKLQKLRKKYKNN